jgi:hypothetical protein
MDELEGGIRQMTLAEFKELKKRACKGANLNLSEVVTELKGPRRFGSRTLPSKLANSFANLVQQKFDKAQANVRETMNKTTTSMFTLVSDVLTSGRDIDIIHTTDYKVYENYPLIDEGLKKLRSVYTMFEEFTNFPELHVWKQQLLPDSSESAITPRVSFMVYESYYKPYQTTLFLRDIKMYPLDDREDAEPTTTLAQFPYYQTVLRPPLSRFRSQAMSLQEVVSFWQEQLTAIVDNDAALDNLVVGAQDVPMLAAGARKKQPRRGKIDGAKEGEFSYQSTPIAENAKRNEMKRLDAEANYIRELPLSTVDTVLDLLTREIEQFNENTVSLPTGASRQLVKIDGGFLKVLLRRAVAEPHGYREELSPPFTSNELLFYAENLYQVRESIKNKVTEFLKRRSLSGEDVARVEAKLNEFLNLPNFGLVEKFTVNTIQQEGGELDIAAPEDQYTIPVRIALPEWNWDTVKYADILKLLYVTYNLDPHTPYTADGLLPVARDWLHRLRDTGKKLRVTTFTQDVALNFIIQRPELAVLKLTVKPAVVIRGIFFQTRLPKLIQSLESITALKTCENNPMESTSRFRLEAELSCIIHAVADDPNKKSNSHLNFLLMGPAGSGKTRFADLIADVLKNTGLLLSSAPKDVISKPELVGQFLGETAPKTKARLFANLENVIFLDEAYTLTQRDSKGDWDPYGYEAIGEIINFLDKNKGSVALIAAGYQGEMLNKFLAINQGQKRRFPHQFVLPDYSAAELVALLCYFIEKNGKLRRPVVDVGASEKMQEFLENPRNKRELFPNSAGDMENFATIASRLLSWKRRAPGMEGAMLTEADLFNIMQVYCISTKNKICTIVPGAPAEEEGVPPRRDKALLEAALEAAQQGFKRAAEQFELTGTPVARVNKLNALADALEIQAQISRLEGDESGAQYLEERAALARSGQLGAPAAAVAGVSEDVARVASQLQQRLQDSVVQQQQTAAELAQVRQQLNAIRSRQQMEAASLQTSQATATEIQRLRDEVEALRQVAAARLVRGEEEEAAQRARAMEEEARRREEARRAAEEAAAAQRAREEARRAAEEAAAAQRAREEARRAEEAAAAQRAREAEEAQRAREAAAAQRARDEAVAAQRAREAEEARRAEAARRSAYESSSEEELVQRRRSGPRSVAPPETDSDTDSEEEPARLQRLKRKRDSRTAAIAGPSVPLMPSAGPSVPLMPSAGPSVPLMPRAGPSVREAAQQAARLVEAAGRELEDEEEDIEFLGSRPSQRQRLRGGRLGGGYNLPSGYLGMKVIP